ncbi:DNA-packaging protein [Pelagibacterium limicola]|uniref:DNA-packaging protein n=1 Tax=Pelagibacterium limicola TaxID=2791022 RepID=UPI0031B6006C
MRGAQEPPDGDWTTWLLIGGRGSGKTRAGAEWVRLLALADPPVSPIALVGETMAEARAVMVEGVSGLLAIHPYDQRPHFDASRHMLTWDNGAQAMLLPANDPERFRGPQFAAAWSDELAKWPNAEAAWDMLQFALRLGKRPQQIVTTTPRPTRLLRRLIGEPGTVRTEMPTVSNAANLAPQFLSAVVGRYEGTALGRQELNGEFIEDVPGALWTRSSIEAARIGTVPDLRRIVVAVDPPVTGTARSDACGIIVAGRADDIAVVLDDCTVQGVTPIRWASLAVMAFHEFEADAIVAEVNQGGDLVRAVIGQVDAAVPVREVRATRGKWVRAEPVAALYARGRVKHAAPFPELEDQMCAFGADGMADGHSPDRVDALVWAITALMLQDGPVPRVR